MLSYESSFDEIDELFEASSSSVGNSFNSFMEEVLNVFAKEYFRHPTEDYLKRKLEINAGRRFPGCVGSWDSKKWEWKSYKLACAWKFKGKEKEQKIVLYAIADCELWICGRHMGKPGSLNDLNILDSSPLITGILQGLVLP